MFYPELINVPPVLDFEASSLDPIDSYPVSVGLVVAGKTYESIIRPEPDWTDWDGNSERIHGMSREYIIEHGKESMLVVAELQEMLGSNQFIYSDNPWWEAHWAETLGLEGRMFRYTQSLLSPYRISEIEDKMESIRKSRNLTHHSALDDAIAISFMLQELM